MQLKLVAVFFVLSFFYSHAYVPRFFRGRPVGGLVGEPGLIHRSPSERKRILSNPAPDQWFVQKLDHFNGSDTRTWKQRYFTNAEFYTAGGPLFVMIGGEGTASPIWMQEGQWIEMAKENNAYCVQLEHRFYGKSHPTPDMSDENLVYLSSEQAIADLASFITAQKSLTKANKVITFGGSYPGDLSAWMRLKYPKLVTGAVSSSAPVTAKVNFKEYLEVVTTSLGTYSKGEECVEAIAKATQAVEGLTKSYVGRRLLKDDLYLCDDIHFGRIDDLANLMATLAGNFEGVVQYNKDNRKFEGAVASNITIDTLCDIMTNTSKGDPFDRYVQVNGLLLDAYGAECQDFKYDKMIDSLKEVSWSSSAAEGGRQWTYQTCAEFGYYQSSDYDKQPFGSYFPVRFWTKQCVDIFGEKFTYGSIAKAVNRTNSIYHGTDIHYDGVIFVNGLIDPWHYLGKITQSGPDQVIVIPGTAHCANMYPSSPSDPPALVKARAEIAKTVSKWVQG